MPKSKVVKKQSAPPRRQNKTIEEVKVTPVVEINEVVSQIETKKMKKKYKRELKNAKKVDINNQYSKKKKKFLIV